MSNSNLMVCPRCTSKDLGFECIVLACIECGERVYGSKDKAGLIEGSSIADDRVRLALADAAIQADKRLIHIWEHAGTGEIEVRDWKNLNRLKLASREAHVAYDEMKVKI